MARRSARYRRWSASALPALMAVIACALVASGRAAPAADIVMPAGCVALPPDWQIATAPLEQRQASTTPAGCASCRGYLIGAGALIVVQGAALIALLNRRRRDRSDGAQTQRSEFLHLSRLALVGELTASIAHEINQPLGAILSNADAAELLLDSGASNPELLRQILADIRRDDIRASEVISHIRALLGKRTAEPRAVDLALVGGNALRLIGPEAERRGVALECRFATPLPPVVGDQVQLEQVLLNLLLNGMQAMANTPAERRRLQLCIDAAGDGRLVMSVSDFGEGIAAGRLGQLFDSFYTTRENGMGLGLAITRSIVEAHGGSIDATNRPGGGAAFRVALPAAGHLSIAETYHEQSRSGRSYC